MANKMQLFKSFKKGFYALNQLLNMMLTVKIMTRLKK